MIDMSTLTPSDIGREVIYLSHNQTEYGWLKSWNDQYIFVVYSQASMGRGIATRPEDCHWSEIAQRERATDKTDVTQRSKT